MVKLQNTTALIAEIFRHETGEILRGAPVRLEGGVVNQVYKVGIADQDYVIRFNPNVLDIYRKEEWVMAQAAAQGVPVPAVHAVGQHEDLSYMIMDRIEGVPATHYKGNLNAVFHEAGRLTRLVNGIAVDGCGYHLHFDPAPRFGGRWMDGVNWDLKSIFAENTLVRIGAMDDAQFKKAKVFLEPMMDWDDRLPRLAHCDVKPGNLMVTPAEAVYMIDWTNAQGGPSPYLDLGGFVIMPESQPHVAAFLDGYRLDHQERDRMRADIYRLGVKNILRAAIWAAGEENMDMTKFLNDINFVLSNVLPAVEGPLLHKKPSLAF